MQVWWKRTSFGWLLVQSAVLGAFGSVVGPGTVWLKSRDLSWPTVLIMMGTTFVVITSVMAGAAWRNIRKAAR